MSAVNAVREMYTPLELSVGVLYACPVCRAPAELWQYSPSAEAPATKVVMCSNGDAIGPRDITMAEGCLLYMPPDDFYRATAREAVRYWNDYGTALLALQRKNGGRAPAPRAPAAPKAEAKPAAVDWNKPAAVVKVAKPERPAPAPAPALAAAPTPFADQEHPPLRVEHAGGVPMRPGSEDALEIPSLISGLLHYRNGRITTREGVEVQPARAAVDTYTPSREGRNADARMGHPDGRFAR